MNCQVQTNEFGELCVVVSKHLGEVERPILVCINGANARTVLVRVAVHQGGDSGQLGDEIHGVFIEILKNKDLLVIYIQHLVILLVSAYKKHS